VRYRIKNKTIEAISHRLQRLVLRVFWPGVEVRCSIDSAGNINKKRSYCYHCGTGVRNQKYCHNCGYKLQWFKS